MDADTNADSDADAGDSAIAVPGLCPGELKTQILQDIRRDYQLVFFLLDGEETKKSLLTTHFQKLKTLFVVFLTDLFWALYYFYYLLMTCL